MPAVPAKSVTEILGLPDPPRTGRERLLAAAIELFYRSDGRLVDDQQRVPIGGWSPYRSATGRGPKVGCQFRAA